jgi:putative ABC transport system permease protein
VRDGEIAVNATAGVSVGEKTRVLLAGGRQDAVTVVGLFRYRPLGDPIPVVAYDAGSTVLGTDYQRVELTGGDVNTVRTLYPDATTGAALVAAARDQAASDAEDLRETLLPFAAVALLVGMFVIANTFSMLITQRTRQYALLRAVGTLRRQVRRSILVEAVVLGLIGGTVGEIVGIALGPLMIAVLRPGQDIDYTVTPLAIGIGYAVAVVVTTLAAYGSARRAATVPPVAALRLDAGASLRTRTVLGLLAVLAGVIAVVATADPSADTTARIVAICGAILVALGILLLAPVLAGLALRPLIALTRRFAGPATRLGAQNAARDPRRTAGTAAAITVGLGLVCAFGTLSATLTDLIGSADRANIPATTTILEPAAGRSASLDAADLAKVRAVSGVTAAAAARDIIADVNGSQFKVTAIEPSALGTVLTPQLAAGSSDLRRGVVISQNQADMMAVHVGDTLTLRLDSAQIRIPVAGIYRATELQSGLYFDVSRAPAQIRDRLSLIYATGSLQALDNAFRDRPDVLVTSRDGLIAADIAEQSLAFVVIDAMFGVAVIIGVFGVVNTLVLSVLERTREIALTRALGASRRLIRRMITMESLLISLFGGLLGVLLGISVGAVMQHAMLGQPLLAFAVPYDAVALSLPGILAAAVLAALWPAHRASRTDVLSAIAG